MGRARFHLLWKQCGLFQLHCLRELMAPAATFLIAALLAAPQLHADQCRTIQFKPAPRIFNTPIFDQAGERLLLVDIAAGGIDVYSLSGDLEKTITRPGPDPLDFSMPNTIFPTQTGYLLRNGGGHFVVLNRDLAPLRALDMGDDEPSWDTAPFQWSPNDNGIIAYGEVRAASDAPWKLGIFRQVSGEKAAPRVLKEIPGNERKEAYLFDGDFVATVGRLSYVLSFSPDYGVFQVDGNNVRLLTGLPEGFGAPPRLPKSQGRSTTALMYAALSRTKSVSGLAVVDGRLYVLLRNFENGIRTWFLAEYDPAKQATVSIVQLPTSAEHVEIASGKQWVAVVGKGPFLTEERFTPDKVTLIPTSVLRGIRGGSLESPRKPCNG